MYIFGQLLTPVAYLRIRHPVKPWFDWYIPAAISIAVFCAIFYAPEPVRIFGEGGLVFIVTDLIKMLIGFYIAALAAVATFSREGMDDELLGDPAILPVRRKGVPKDSRLTRRRFLSYLFGYLALAGLVLYFSGAATSLFGPNLALLQAAKWGSALKWLFVFVYIFITANLLTTTLLGLHFLTDRIHR